MLLAPALTLSAGSGAAIVRPTFSRDFAGEKTLNNGTGPAITFTRGSQATYFTADGTLRFAPHNAARNSEAGGASAGVGPTHWITSATANNVTRTIVGSGTEDGLTYLEIRYAGTPAAGGGFTIAFDSSSQVVADAGQTWTNSAFCKLQAGSLTGITAVQIGVDGRSSAGAELSPVQRTMTAFTPTGAALGTQRVSVTRTMAAGAERAFPFILVNYTGGVAMDITLRIAAPQLERNATASDYIPTTGTANFDQPRFDHDPATGASRGLLIEEARTNSITRSIDFANAAWGKFNVTVTANTDLAPDGTTTASTITDATTSAGDHLLDGGGALTGLTDASIVTFSVFLKKTVGASHYPALRILFTGGTAYQRTIIVNTNTGAFTVGGSPDVGRVVDAGAYWRVALTASNGLSNVTATGRIYPAWNSTGSGSANGTVTGSVVAWGAQLEQGAFPTSYIPTTTAAATRSADSAVVTPISSFYNQSEGTLFAEASNFGDGINTTSVAFTDGSNTNERFQLRVRGGGLAVVASGNISAGTSNIAPATNVASKKAGAAKLNDFAISTSGGAVEADAAGDMPSVTHLVVGALSTFLVQPLNGHIRKVAYYPKRLSNALLQSLTA